ncbi:ATP-binding protein [Verrucomicrobiota bacterium]
MRIDIPRNVLAEVSALKKARKDVAKRNIRRSSGSRARKKAPRVSVGNRDLNELFQGVYDAAFITSLKGKIVDANTRSSQFFNYTREELLGSSMMEIILGFNEPMIKTICENLKNDRFTLIQAQCMRSNGSHFPSEISTSLLRLSSKDHLCFFVRDVTVRRKAEEALKKAHDNLEREVQQRTIINEELSNEISERKRIEGELQEAVAQLKKHDEAKSQFVFNVSHELKTPLSSIRHASSNMLKGISGALPDKATFYTNMIRQDAQRLARTVEDILDMSRLEAGTLTLRKIKIPFARFVRRSAESLKLQAEAQGLTMKIQTDTVNGFVDCDPQKMERVIYNIIKNAIKFNVKNGTIDITLRADPSVSGFFVLEVEDSGIGIKQENLSHVTERFFRVGEYVSGTGLGLAISKELLERHNGSIDIKSPPPEKEKGTLVSMRIPAAHSPAVLIVSDDKSICEILTNQLKKNAFQVIASNKGEEVVSILKEIKPDIVGLDWIASDMNASITIARIKNDEQLAVIPMFAITGTENEGPKREILTGFNIPILPKPWKEDDLLDCLERLSSLVSPE